jgi:hypothetical protein
MLKILGFALTSPYPIIDPLCKTKKENRTTQENSRSHQIAIHFLATCRAFNIEGQKSLWTNNTFVFTTVQAVKTFAEVDFAYRETVNTATIRVVARYYDDENSVYRLQKDHHPQLSNSIKLKINKRPKELTLARRGFRVYGWLQLVDFLEALLPPHDPSHDLTLPRKRLLPNLEKLRIDLINFGEDLFQPHPAALHDVASHHLGSSLNELIVTGLPRDDSGFRAGSELCGLLKDDGLFIDHAPALLALKNGLRHLHGNHMHMKVVRAMRPSGGVKYHHHDDHTGYFDEFPPAPSDDGDPPYSPYLSCRTMWKKTPVHIDRPKRKWILFDRISGVPWEYIEDEATIFDMMSDTDDEEGSKQHSKLSSHSPYPISRADVTSRVNKALGPTPRTLANIYRRVMLLTRRL